MKIPFIFNIDQKFLSVVTGCVHAQCNESPNLKWNVIVEDLGLDGRIIFKCIITKVKECVELYVHSPSTPSRTILPLSCLKEIEYEGVDWIEQAQDRVQWRVVVEIRVNIRVG